MTIRALVTIVVFALLVAPAVDGKSKKRANGSQKGTEAGAKTEAALGAEAESMGKKAKRKKAKRVKKGRKGKRAKGKRAKGKKGKGKKAKEQAQLESNFLPSSPHRVLKIKGDRSSYLLIEEDKPLEAKCEGPGMLELNLRRVVFPSEPPGKSASIQVSIDKQVEPPLVFRRVRERGVRFIGEGRFFPSAPRFKKIPIPSGSHTVLMELGQNTSAIAVAIKYSQAPEVASAIPPPPPDALEPDLVEPYAETQPESQPAMAVPAEPPVEPVPAEPVSQEPVVTEVAAIDPTATVSPDAEPPVAPEEHSIIDTTPDRPSYTLAFDAGVGVSTTFINIGTAGPSLRLGGRYILPWLDQQLSVGVDIMFMRYSVFARSSALTMEATNWVFPLQATVAYSPNMLDPIHLEVGLGAGLAINSATLLAGEKQSSSTAAGGAAELYAEGGYLLGPGTVYGRVQWDAIVASNDIFVDFNYFGATGAAGYRVMF